MNSPNRPDGWQELEDLLDRFEQGWQNQAPPEIEEFFPPFRGTRKAVSARARRQFLEELVKIDLGHRWRKGLRPSALGPAPNEESNPAKAAGPRLEEYVARFPELGQGEGLSPDLIGEEYRVRQLWGDRPGHDEFLTRFPQPGWKLRESLPRIDQELAAEAVPGRSSPPVAPDPAVFRAPDAVFSPDRHPGLVQPVASVHTLIDSLRRLSLLSAVQWNDIAQAALQGRFPQPRDLARELLQRGWLTAYQVNQLLLGRGPDLMVGPYVLLERLGEGGIGQVFKAQHQRLNRVVALKVIRKELLTDPEVVGRFSREIQVISQLTHPHVVHAYDAGAVGAVHFLAMEYVEGIDLGKLVKQSGPLPVAQACDCIRQAALGLQYAQERGLVHRDIKPSNLMVTKAHGTLAVGVIKILDLGLARLRRPAEEKETAQLAGAVAGSTLTPAGAIMMMGTPDYLAPEQALDFHGADIRADIYSLGCTFFYLLTGQPPFPGGTLPQKLLRHQQAEPPDVGRFRSDLPPGLAAVLAKMMAKRPEERWQQPSEVAAALAKVLADLGTANDRPGHAGRWPRLLSLAARRPRLLGGALLASLLLFFGMVTFKPSAPNKDPFAALIQEGIPPEQRRPWQPTELVAVLGEQRQRHWGTATSVAVSPTQQWVASAGSDKVIRLWDPQTMREQHVLPGHTGEVLSLAFSPDGKMLASGARDLSVRLWDLSGKVPGPAWATGDVGRGFAVAFSPNGRFLAAAGDEKTVRLYDLSEKTPKASHTLTGHTATVFSLAFTPNSRWLASAGGDRTVRLWDLSGKEPRAGPVLTKHTGKVLSVAFAPNGQWLASAGDDKTVRLWDLQGPEPREVYLMAEQFDDPIGWDSAARGRLVAFSPNGRMLAVAGKARTVRWWSWDGTKATEQHALPGHNAMVSAVAYYPDGKKLVSAGYDGTVRLWDLTRDQPQESFPLKGYPCLITAAAFDRDSQKLVAAASNGNTILWDMSQGGPKMENWFEGSPRGDVLSVALSGPMLALGSDRIVLWDLSGTKPFPGPTFRGHKHNVNSMAFAGPDGQRLASGSVDKTVRLWDPRGAKAGPVGEPRENPAEVSAVAYAPDGRRLASAGQDGSVRLWNVAGDGLQLVHEFSGRGPLAFSVDGKMLAATGADNDKRIQLWDLSEGKPKGRAVLDGNLSSPPLTMAFSPNGRTMACANASGQIFVWELASGNILKKWESPGPIRAVAFSSNSQFLITANVNNTVWILQLPQTQAKANP